MPSVFLWNMLEGNMFAEFRADSRETLEAWLQADGMHIDWLVRRGGKRATASSSLSSRAFGPRKCMKNDTGRSCLFNGLVGFWTLFPRARF